MTNSGSIRVFSTSHLANHTDQFILGDLLKDRAFEFAVERAAFVATPHRIFVSGSDRDCASWMEDYDIPDTEGLDLHHFYRAMAWLGEEMEEKSEDALAPRCVKDAIEEKLFDKRRDLFADLSAVFCSFLALAMQKHLDDLSREAGATPEWKDLLRDLDRLQHIRLAYRGADWLVRTDATPNVAALFRHAHIALPPRAKQTAPPKAVSSSISIRKRRGRPKRSATSS